MSRLATRKLGLDWLFLWPDQNFFQSLLPSSFPLNENHLSAAFDIFPSSAAEKYKGTTYNNLYGEATPRQKGVPYQACGI